MFNKYFEGACKDDEIDEFVRDVLFELPGRTKTATGRYILMNKRSKFFNTINGFRYTTDTPETYDASIYIYGNCNAVGFFAHDSMTCASQLQRKLNMHPVNKKTWCVKNRANWLDLQPTIADLLCDQFKTGDYVIVLNIIGSELNECKNATYHGIPFVNIDNIFQSEKSISLDGYHLTPTGHTLLANIFYDMLMKEEKEESRCVKAGTETVFLKEKEHLKEDTEYFSQPLPRKIPSELKDYLSTLEPVKKQSRRPVGSIVMNCNPFTKGHRYLVEQALGQCEYLIVFVVQEDKSTFSFIERIEMVRRGTADLKNMAVVPSGKFILSMDTFPEYFNKDSNIQGDAAIDIRLFGEVISPYLNISKRFVGEEPKCQVTRAYNMAMKKELPHHKVEVVFFPRIESDGDVISASRVRELLKNGKKEELLKLVPLTTYEYLRTLHML